MAKIFSAPKGFKAPEFKDYIDMDNSVQEYIKAQESYVSEIKKAIRNAYRAQCPEAGKEIQFPVGDGKACYVVAKLKPVELVWIDGGDNYHFEYANRLTASDVRKEIKKVEGLRSIFSKKNKEKADA